MRSGHGEACGGTATTQQESQDGEWVVVVVEVEDGNASQREGPIFVWAMAGTLGHTKCKVEAAIHGSRVSRG
jgi:hypothetical protein